MNIVGTGSTTVLDLRLQTGSRNYLRNSKSLENYVLVLMDLIFYTDEDTICGLAICNSEQEEEEEEI